MDIRQYGPALFPTLKQTRRILDGEGRASGHPRDEAPVSGPDGSPRDSGSGGGHSGR
jgi:hypothetical protein